MPWFSKKRPSPSATSPVAVVASSAAPRRDEGRAIAPTDPALE